MNQKYGLTLVLFNKLKAIKQLQKKGMTEADAEKLYQKIRKENLHATPKEVRKKVLAEYRKRNRTRLPRNNGHWNGSPGNGIWYSDISAVNAITGGKGIVFKDGRPDFSPWSKGMIRFDDGVLNGTRQDFTKVYEYLRDHSGGKIKSSYQAKKYLSKMGWTPHHLSNNVIILVPTDLHGNIPYIGSASDMRNN